MSRRRPGRGALPWLLLAALATAIYAANWRDYFLGDDFDLIHSFHGKPPRYFVELLWSNESGEVWKAWGIDPALGRGFLRPVKIWALALDLGVWGMRPLGFHLTSSAFFVANVLLIFAILRRALPGRRLLAFAGAWAAALHPVFAEIVPFVTAREELMASGFGLASFLAFLRHRGEGRSSAPFHVFFALALLSKETALGFLALPLGWDLARERPWAARGARAREMLLTYLPGALLLAAYFGLRRAAFGNFMGGDGQPTHFLSPAAFLDFHRLFFRSLVDPTLMAAGHLRGIGAVAGLAAALLAGLIALRIRRIPPRRSQELLFFGPLWYLGSTAILHGTYFTARHNLVPVIGLVLFATVLLGTLLEAGWPAGERFCAAALLLASTLLFLPPTLRTSADFRAASAAVARIRADIEARTAGLPPGSAVELRGVPQWILPPFFFGWGLLSSLQRPFTASDLAARSTVIDLRNLELTRAAIAIPERYDLVVELDPRAWVTPEIEQRHLERLWRDGLVPRGSRRIP